MTTPFDTARQSLVSLIPFGETVAIMRGSTSIGSSVPAKSAGTAYVTQTRDGLTLHTAGQDFIVRRSSLSQLPQPRDTVTWNGETYIVVQPQRGEPCWRIHDRSGEIIRIHTKKRAAAQEGEE